MKIGYCRVFLFVFVIFGFGCGCLFVCGFLVPFFFSVSVGYFSQRLLGHEPSNAPMLNFRNKREHGVSIE